jgi:predicted DNA-binding transcriptional regulator YafY
MLSSNVDYTTNELASNLEITERSAFRYIRTFKDSGFTIQKRGCNVHKLMKMPVRQIELSELIHLSPEEAHILHTLLMSISGDSQVLVNLEKKLIALFDATSVTEIIGNKTAAENLMRLREAMDDKTQVMLKDYESGNTMTVSDRLVEPYGFSTNYCDVYAFEIATGLNKTFKVSRIGYVMPQQTDWEHEDQHEVIEPDCFRMNGKENIPVTLKMTMKAKNLLVEEFPLASRDLTFEEGFWWLRTTVKDLAGVGRFVIGLADQIEIINSPELVGHIKLFLESNLYKFCLSSNLRL